MILTERIQHYNNCMTEDIAQAIKHARVTNDCTWSKTAQLIKELYPHLNIRLHVIGGGYTTDGKMLCEAAQDFLKEDWQDTIF